MNFLVADKCQIDTHGFHVAPSPVMSYMILK